MTTAKHTKIALIILAACLLILTACNNQTNPNQTDCQSMSGQAKENCYYEAKTCSEMLESDFKNSCIVEQARDQNNSATCETLNNDKSKGYCLEQIALKNQDKEMCTKINDTYWKDNCNYNLAITLNKEGLCYLLQPTNVEQKTDCFMKVALSKGKVEVCDFLPGQGRESCIFQVAVKTKNAESCDLMQDQINVGACRLKIAKVTNNQDLCETIKFKQAKDVCTTYFEQKPEEITNNNTNNTI